MLLAHRQSSLPQSRHAGFTLVEVLVTFVILAIGVLGIVSLLVTSKTSQYEAVQRARAVNLADAIVEKIRANPEAAAAYHTGISTSIPVNYTARTEPSPNCASAACTDAQLVQYDLWLWERALLGATVQAGGTNTAGLLFPRACIDFAAQTGKTNTGKLSVLIQWVGLQETGDGVGPGQDECGSLPSEYPDEEKRRSIVVSTYIVDPSE